MRPGKVWAATCVAVAATTAGCSSPGTGALTPHLPTESQSLQSLQAHLSQPSATSEIFADGTTHSVAIAVMQQLRDPAVPEVDIYRWQRHTWTSAARITLDVGGSVAADGSTATAPIGTADITPATSPELVVTVHYNAGPATAILSTYGGRWHALTFHGGLTQDGDERFDVRVRTDGTLTSKENDCVPNCALGHTVSTSYRFSTATGRLEAYTNR